MRVAPAASIFNADVQSRTPPEALTPTSAPTAGNKETLQPAALSANHRTKPLVSPRLTRREHRTIPPCGRQQIGPREELDQQGADYEPGDVRHECNTAP